MDIALVTGGTGFVGANLARRLLEKGWRVRVLARPTSSRKGLQGCDVEWTVGDVLDPKSLERAVRGCRYVFHVAADYRIWVRNPEEMMRTNIDGTRNVITAAGRAGAERIVHCSSVAAVRPTANCKPADESSCYTDLSQIIGPYKKSKFLSELAALELAAKGLPVVVVNPSAPVGPYDSKPTPTGRIILDFLKRRIPAYIDTGLNLVSSRDVAEGHLLAAARGRAGERYILGGENLAFKQVLDLLAEVTGLPAPRLRTPYWAAYLFGAADTARAWIFGGEPRAPLDAVRMARHVMFFDSAKARQELGYAPTPVRAALADAADWFSANGYLETARR